MNDISHMTGEAQYRKPKLLKLKSLKLNGDTGKFVLTHLDEAKGEDGRYKKDEIEGPIDVVFLKVRRRLFEADAKGMVRSTSEHNMPNDTVMLFQRDGQDGEKGVARELRQKYQSLRTEQIVYVRYKGQIVRLHVKGASLGSENKDKATTDFYSYLSSFNEGEHWYERFTKLVPVAESGARSYYCIDFQRGDALESDQIEKVVANITTVHENCAAFDAYYKTETVETIKKEAQDEPAVVPEYPEEEINPEDIPFN